MEKGSNELKDKKYIQISRLLLDKRSSEPRDEIHNILFEIGLFSNMMLKEWLTLKEIQDSVAYEIGIESYPIEPLKRAIPRLSEEKRIKIKEDQNNTFYCLTKERKEQLQKYKNESDSLYQKITNDLIEEIKSDAGDLTNKEIDTICEVFDLTLSSVFVAMENVSTLILNGGKEITKEIMIDVPYEFKNHLRRIDKSTLRKSVSTNIRKMILNPSTEMKRYFFRSANTSFIMKLLNLDPECQALEKYVFSNISLFLDTNVVISVLFPSAELHEMTCEVLKESAKLGVQLKVTSRTLNELKNVLDRTDSLYSKSQKPSRSKFYIPENTIIETFIRYAETKGDTWETFLLASRRKKTHLEKKYNVKFDSTDYKDFLDEEKLIEMSKIVKDCSQQRQSPKSDDVSEHDAYHFLIINHLRETLDTPNNIWFLSQDRTFACVNRAYFQLEQKTLPCSLMCSSWLEVIFPFLSPDISEARFEDIFQKIMGSDFFSMTGSLSFGNLTRFFAPFFDDEYLDEGDYVSILQDQVLNRVLEDWQKSDYRFEYDAEIAKTIAELVDKRKDEKLKKMEKELEREKTNSKVLSDGLTTMKSQIGTSEIESKERIEIEKEMRIKNRRFGELFIGVLSTIITILLLVYVGINDVQTVIAIVGSGCAIGGTFLGLYHWLTKELK